MANAEDADETGATKAIGLAGDPFKCPSKVYARVCVDEGRIDKEAPPLGSGEMSRRRVAFDSAARLAIQKLIDPVSQDVELLPTTWNTADEIDGRYADYCDTHISVYLHGRLSEPLDDAQRESFGKAIKHAHHLVRQHEHRCTHDNGTPCEPPGTVRALFAHSWIQIFE